MRKKGMLIVLILAISVLTYGLVQSGVTETVKEEVGKLMGSETEAKDVIIRIKPDGTIKVENAEKVTLDQVNEALAKEYANGKKILNWTTMSVVTSNPCTTIYIGGTPYLYCWGQ